MVDIDDSHESRLKAQHEHFTSSCDSLGDKVEGYQLGLSARLDELDATVVKQYSHFTHVCTTLDTKFSMKATAQDERLESESQHFNRLCSNVDKKCTEIGV